MSAISGSAPSLPDAARVVRPARAHPARGPHDDCVPETAQAVTPARRLTSPVPDPLSGAAALARQAGVPFVLYERCRCWSVASGALAELRMDRTGLRLRTASDERIEPIGDAPLQQVAELLAGLPLPRWRAYGWVGFELGHLLHGDPEAAGDASLLHLVVPEREVTLGPEGVELTSSTEAGLDAAATTLNAPVPRWPGPVAQLDVATPGANTYRRAVADAVRDIRANRLNKVILSRVVPVPGEIDMVATYVAGRRGNTPARSFVLDLGGLRATGFSPETVVEVTADGWVSTQPLAGTRALAGDPVSDLARRVELLGDPKEIFEHAISVRLAQDELRAVCRQGTVRVDEFMSVQERGSVQHLASRVSGRLADGRNAWHAFAALFPAVTASGIPKAPACELIVRYEEQPRGLYSGAVLSVDSDGALDAALVLRTVFAQHGRTWLRAGAGVVGLSTPDRELEETCEKLRSVSRFLVPAGHHPALEPSPADVMVSTSHPAAEGLDLTVHGLRRAAADLTEEDAASIGAQTNLFEFGLESVALMQLVSTWRRAGIDVDFAELAGNPTLDGWAKLLAQRAPTADGPDGGSVGVRSTIGGTSDTSVAVAQRLDADATGDSFPLAALQHAYWIGRRSQQWLGGVAAHLYAEFDGADVQPERLRVAFDRLVARHERLRVAVTNNGRQRIVETPGWRGLTVYDLRALGEDQRRAQLAAIRDRYSHQMLDIEAAEVFASTLSLLPGGRTRLHLDVDMVAADAVSYRIMLADLARLYAHPDEEFPALEYSFREYQKARPQARRGAARQAARWWTDRLPALPGPPELPVRQPRPAGPAATCVTRRERVLPPAERTALAENARAHGLTTAMVVATAFAEIIGTWSAQSRFLLNVPLFGREPLHPDVAHIVGDFTSTVLLEIDLTEPLTFTERARAVQARMHADAAHADYTGAEVLRDLTQRAGAQMLAPVVFTSALGLGELFDASVQRSFGDPVWIISQGPQVLLDAQVTELNGGLLVNWDAREGQFPDGVLDAMFTAFAVLVRRLAHDTAVWREPVTGLLPAAQRTRRNEANATTAPRSHRRLHDGFFAHAAATPDAPALIGEQTMTYGQLADHALRVAAALVDRGVAPGDPVGVTLPPGPDQSAAVLGVLAAGGVYVPVGVEQPPGRAERIARLSGHRVVITEGGMAAAPGARARGATATAVPLPAPIPGDEEDLAYIVFTSGSTGQPKGVEVPHRAAMATIDDLVERFALGPEDRTLALSTLDFDLSVFGLFAPLSVSGAVVPVAGPDRRDPHAWAELITTRGVTVLNCVPALLDMLLTSGAQLGTSLRLVLLGSDWVGVDLPGRLAATVPGCRFVALGGTTETASHSTVCEVTGPVPADWTSVPYGAPLRNVRCRVVDPLGRDCPDWVPGELWIGGDGVARGYRGDPELTGDRFVMHDGLRWYRTGDLARYRGASPALATIEFLGRRDNQRLEARAGRYLQVAVAADDDGATYLADRQVTL